MELSTKLCKYCPFESLSPLLGIHPEEVPLVIKNTGKQLFRKDLFLLRNYGTALRARIVCSHNGEPFGSKKQEMLWKDKDILAEKKKPSTKQTYTVQLSMKQKTVFKETHEYEPEITDI